MCLDATQQSTWEALCLSASPWLSNDNYYSIFCVQHLIPYGLRQPRHCLATDDIELTLDKADDGDFVASHFALPQYFA